jgi:Holliday junction resolvasome RuvABC endonuclease subunit
VSAPRVVGLDLSITATGIAFRDGSTATVRTREEDGDRRLLDVEQHVRVAVGDPDIGLGPLPDLVVLEDLPTHARAAGITGMVHGVVRAMLLDLGVPYVLLTPATLKAFATGSGTADKTAMAITALKRADREFPGDKGGNECDAWWLRAAGLDRLGHPLFPLPAAQRARLGKPHWPDLPVSEGPA